MHRNKILNRWKWYLDKNPYLVQRLVVLFSFTWDWKLIQNSVCHFMPINTLQLHALIVLARLCLTASTFKQQNPWTDICHYTQGLLVLLILTIAWTLLSVIQLKLLSVKSYLMSLLCVWLAIHRYLTSFITA